MQSIILPLLKCKHWRRADSALNNWHWKERLRSRGKEEGGEGQFGSLCICTVSAPGRVAACQLQRFGRGQEHPWVVFTFPVALPAARPSDGQLSPEIPRTGVPFNTWSRSDGTRGEFQELIIKGSMNRAGSQRLSSFLPQILRNAFLGRRSEQALKAGNLRCCWVTFNETQTKREV